MVRIYSFEMHGPYGFVFTHCALSCKENMNCIGIFATPPCVAVAVYIHTWCNLSITWENSLFLYFIFVQHWTCDSGFFHYYIYCSLHGTVETGYIFKNFCNAFFMAHMYFSEVLQVNTLLERKHFLHALTYCIWDKTHKRSSISGFSADKMTQLSMDSHCLSEIIFPCAQGTDKRYAL
jgi:hypothetical protein